MQPSDGPLERYEHDEDAQEGASALGILRFGWGIFAILALAVYSLAQTLFAAEPPAPRVIGAKTATQALAAVRSQQPVYIGGKAFLPAPPAETELVVHFACDQEDARIARIYDPPPTGRSIILRIDQSPDEMRALYRGTDPRYPKDTRVVTTPCMQDLINYGEFP